MVAWVWAHAPVQRHRRDHVRGQLVLDQQVADLRAVAVGEHDLDAGGDEVGDVLRPRRAIASPLGVRGGASRRARSWRCRRERSRRDGSAHRATLAGDPLAVK